jgi:hypothetical protein
MWAMMLVTAPLGFQSRELTYDFTMQVLLFCDDPTSCTDSQPRPYTSFSGTFVFDTNGTAFCSAAFCPSGAIPDFTRVNIHNPLLDADPYLGANEFTEVTGGAPLTFIG